MNKLKTLEWFEEDGCLGGHRGLTINLIKNEVIKWNGDPEPISFDNIDDVKWCIDKNIDSINKEITRLNVKIKQKEAQYTRIKNGHSISNPLSTSQKLDYNKRIDILIEKLNTIKKINFKLIWKN
tara:strand:- start:357 stop:731 length:375 start_codon:yes stop_codon:yes gene_type:complete